jgi:hypothetical protein
VGKPEGKRPVGRPGPAWEDNIKIYLGERRWGGMDWIDLAQDRDRWRALMYTFRVPYNVSSTLLVMIMCCSVWEILE